MAIASLVLGLISALTSIFMSFIPIPYCGTIVFLPALIGLILGVISNKQLIKKDKPNAIAVFGVGLNAVTLIIILSTSIMTTIGGMI